MVIFGVGATLSVVILALVSPTAMMRMRGKLMQSGKAGKVALGVIVVALAALIVTGADKPMESYLVDQSPAWLTNLTTRF